MNSKMDMHRQWIEKEFMDLNKMMTNALAQQALNATKVLLESSTLYDPFVGGCKQLGDVG